MPIPVMQFQPMTGAGASPLGYGLQNLSQGLLKGMALHQQIQEQKMKEGMIPLQQQLLQAQIAAQEAKTSGMPGAAMQQQELKQRAQDNKLIELVNQNPALKSDPRVHQQWQSALTRISQPISALTSMSAPAAPTPGMPVPAGLPPQAAQAAPAQDPTEPGLQLPGAQEMIQQPEEVTLTPEEKMDLMSEQKNIPSDIKNQQVRSTSAKIMLDRIEKKIRKLKPFFGAKQSLSKAFRTYAANAGLSDDEAARQYNTLTKDIMAAAGEVAAGMTKSRAQSTLQEWQDIVNPITSSVVGFDQVMDNLNSVKDMHSINHDTLFYQYPMSKKMSDRFVKERSDVPRETISEQKPQFTADQARAELKRRGILK